MAQISSPAIATQHTLPVSPMLNVLVIDSDLSVLEYITKACTHSSYQVIPCSESLPAANFLRERKELIHLILIEVHMPLMDGYEFLQFVKQEQINVPLVLMSTDNNNASVMKAIEVGACDYWNKPLEEKRIVNMWAYVLKSSTSEDTKQKDIGSQKDDDRRRVKSDNSEFASSVVDFDVGESKNANPPSRKKKRIVWSTELHELFLIAMDKAGGEDAVPKKILEAMNVPGLERGHVASHLQKHRKYLRKKKEMEMSLASGNTEPERIHLQSSTSLTDFHHPGFTGNMGPKGEQHFPAEEALAHHQNSPLATFSNMAMAENSPLFMRNIMQQYHHQIHPFNFHSSSITISGNPAFVPQNYNSGINMNNGLTSLQSIQGGNSIGEVIQNQDTTGASVYYPQSQNAGLSSYAVRYSDATEFSSQSLSTDIDNATTEEQLILLTMDESITRPAS
ncbi:hypothetical protein PHAVU_002G322000 [Phaseolus vulgaris]|uniref:Response regulatory domain-containing protein n=2 Tax=Phaseolus vulgaris TaxID=3885 RepID=V7CU46_PHAVU|nr:hypothetical protein PHAVU_002G322000g [Phaseolus vulgaris]ESW32431.1 hypothetical protein PHAVU_002G322000g [Phaseolus vulgaris]